MVIVDGPTGIDRRKWYPLLKKCTRKGTIVVIDDFRHFPEYEKALNILKGKKAILIKGARLLLEKEKLDSDELKALIKEESPKAND